VQLLKHNYDDGKHFHHVFVTSEHLQSAIELAGHEELERTALWAGHLVDHGPIQDVAVVTRAK
jgi:hypothetical protein